MLSAPARRLLARIDDEPRAYLDVGAGTGCLVLAAAARWPEARIVGLDASAAMLSVARHRLALERPGDDPGRYHWLVTDAASTALPDESVDISTSSFMLQLVQDRRATLSEMGRVLRPGAILGMVTWIADDLELPADDVFEDCVAELGVASEDQHLAPRRSGEYESLAEAQTELLETGFTNVVVRSDELAYTWSPREYLAFKEHYDEREIFEALDEATRQQVQQALAARMAQLPLDAFRLSGSLVSATARRPRSG